MITISKSKLIRAQFCDADGRRCMVGEVLHHYGVDDDTMRENSYTFMRKAVNDPEVRDTIFHITSEGHYSLTRSIMAVTEANDHEEFERAAELLKRMGIEVVLVD